MPPTFLIARRRALVRVERLAAALDRVAGEHLASLLPPGPPPEPAALAKSLRPALERLQGALAAALVAGLVRLARLTHADAARLLARRVRRRGGAGVRTSEDLGPDEIARLILQPPSAEQLLALVGVAPVRITRAAAPERVTGQLLAGIAQGWDRERIARELKAAFGVAAGTARRIARTEGLKITSAVQVSVAERVPELVVGYVINAVMDSRTRHDHKRRHGTRYYRHPKSGQLGLKEMPLPPAEADGRISWNCRCFLQPFLATDTEDGHDRE